jgi:hypothetical protein
MHFPDNAPVIIDVFEHLKGDDGANSRSGPGALRGSAHAFAASFMNCSS